MPAHVRARPKPPTRSSQMRSHLLLPPPALAREPCRPILTDRPTFFTGDISSVDDRSMQDRTYLKHTFGPRCRAAQHFCLAIFPPSATAPDRIEQVGPLCRVGRHFPLEILRPLMSDPGRIVQIRNARSDLFAASPNTFTGRKSSVDDCARRHRTRSGNTFVIGWKCSRAA